jgi:hypothetical protein
MMGFGVTPIGSREHGLPSAFHDTLAAVAIPLVALAAFVFVLIVLPWIISI